MRPWTAEKPRPQALECSRVKGLTAAQQRLGLLDELLLGLLEEGDVSGLRNNAMQDLGRCSSQQTGGPKGKQVQGLAGLPDYRNWLLFLCCPNTS